MIRTPIYKSFSFILLTAALLAGCSGGDTTTTVQTIQTTPTIAVSLDIGVPISPITPISGANVTSCQVQPALPAGLQLDPKTCTLSGTPTVLQPSARYLVSASTPGGALSAYVNLSVVRVLLGELDTAFNSTGIADASLLDTNQYGYLEGLTVQKNGTILFGAQGTAEAYSNQLFNADGSAAANLGLALDDTCATLFGAPCYSGAAKVQSDGKTLVSYQASTAPTQTGALVRYNVDGSLDTSWGTGGIAIFPLEGRDTPKRIFQLANGQILVLAALTQGPDINYSAYLYTQKPAVLRFNTDGSLDTTFGTGGVAWILNPMYFAASMDVDPASGKIYVGGRDANGGPWQEMVARLNANGSLDTSYGTAGYVQLSWARRSMDIAFDPASGGLLLALNEQAFPVSNQNQIGLSVMRLLPSGAPDISFATGGTATYAVNNAGAGEGYYSTRIKLDPSSGKYLILGNMTPASGAAPKSHFYLTRMNADGSLDAAFGSQGHVEGNDSVNLNLSSIEFTADQRVVLGGLVTNYTSFSFPFGPTLYFPSSWDAAVVMIK
jgi:uncharacterized delta-60 repeat protein